LAIDSTVTTLTGTQTLTNKTLTSPVLTTPSISNIDAKGDLLAGTADNTIGTRSIGANGTVLTADSAEATGMKWATVSSGSFILTSNSTFSSVTSSSVNNCFSSTYDSYRIIISFDASASDSNVYLRLRGGGSDLSSSTYNVQDIQAFSSTTAAARNNSATLIEKIAYTTASGAAAGGFSIIDIINPGIAKPTFFKVSAIYGGGTSLEIHETVASNSNATAYDGFSIINNSAANMTGRIRVYGYSNS
jgi:hypothetical protein